MEQKNQNEKGGDSIAESSSDSQNVRDKQTVEEFKQEIKNGEEKEEKLRKEISKIKEKIEELKCEKFDLEKEIRNLGNPGKRGHLSSIEKIENQTGKTIEKTGSFKGRKVFKIDGEWCRVFLDMDDTNKVKNVEPIGR